MIERQQQDEVATLKLRHGKANALDLELAERLESEFAALAEDTSVKALVLTGQGTIFCAGVNLLRVVEEGPDYLQRFLPALSRAIRSLFTLPKPVVAAVNGHAIAGGCILAVACDQRIMAPIGRIGVPELAVGVPLPVTAFEVLRHAMTRQRIPAELYTARTHAAEAAQALGLVDELSAAEHLESRSLALARELGRIPSQSFALTKQLARQPALDRIERHQERFGQRIMDAWTSKQTLAHIQEYVSRTLGK